MLRTECEATRLSLSCSRQPGRSNMLPVLLHSYTSIRDFSTSSYFCYLSHILLSSEWITKQSAQDSASRKLRYFTMGCSLIQFSVTFLVTSISILIVYHLSTKNIVTRLRVEQAPKSGFGIVPVNGFGSHAYSGGAEYEPDPPFGRGSADILR